MTITNDGGLTALLRQELRSQRKTIAELREGKLAAEEQVTELAQKVIDAKELRDKYRQEAEGLRDECRKALKLVDGYKGIISALMDTIENGSDAGGRAKTLAMALDAVERVKKAMKNEQTQRT